MNLAQFIGMDPVIDDREEVEDAPASPTAVIRAERNDLAESATHRLESIGLLARGIAHDMNNIFAPILNAAEVLREPRSEAEMALLVRSIEANARRGSELARQLLDFSRGSAATVEDVVLQILILDLVSLIQSTFPKSIKFVTVVPDELWVIRSQRTELMQVLLNLCVNARDAMPTGGVLRIEASNQVLMPGDPRLGKDIKEGAFVVIRVVDTGTGIPKEIQKRIFEPFFSTKTNQGGRGLGLSIVAGIVKKHGGSIVVSTDVGCGTAFEIVLPALDIKQGAQPRTPQSSQFPHPTTVMVIDDEQTVLLTVKTLLSDRGYRVIPVRDGFEAIKALKTAQQKVDVVLTDVRMPTLSGWETISLIRAIEPMMAFVAVSGHARYLASEFSDDVPFLQKPFSGEQLVASIEKSLAMRRNCRGKP